LGDRAFAVRRGRGLGTRRMQVRGHAVEPGHFVGRHHLNHHCFGWRCVEGARADKEPAHGQSREVADDGNGKPSADISVQSDHTGSSRCRPRGLASIQHPRLVARFLSGFAARFRPDSGVRAHMLLADCPVPMRWFHAGGDPSRPIACICAPTARCCAPRCDEMAITLSPTSPAGTTSPACLHAASAIGI
jgi:hypothetical protein